MRAKLKPTRVKWVDPDDAPELTSDFFQNAVSKIGDRVVTHNEFVAEIEARLAAVVRGEARTTPAEEVLRS